MTYRRPTFVSERERAHRWPDGRWDGPAWEDCAPTSLVMAVDGFTLGRLPADHTLVEAEALRAAAGYGPSGGTNIQKLAATAVIRYRIALPKYASGWSAIWAALTPGKCAAVAGSMAAFGPDHRLSRHQPGFDGTHSVYVQREDLTGRVWWMDPLAADTGYGGEWVTSAELRAFFSQGIAAAIVWPLGRG